MDIKPFYRHLAVTPDFHMLKFGNNDLTVYFNNQSVVADIGNAYQAPNVSQTSQFFAGEREFQIDDLEVLVAIGKFISPWLRDKGNLKKRWREPRGGKKRGEV